MKKKLLILSAMVLGTMAGQSAMAQSAAPGDSAAPAKGQVMRDRSNPAADTAKPAPGSTHPAARSEVSSEARRAGKAGEIPVGDKSTTPALEKKKAAGQAGHTREEVKAERPDPHSRAGDSKNLTQPKTAADGSK